MHIRNDPSFFLTNKIRAPQGEELGLMKPLSESSWSWSENSSFQMELNGKVLVLQVQHQVSNRSKIPLVESEEDPASPREIL
ncbi:hypothetical protein Tco_0724780 [Tanacetum coccineum]|uniref:Uncharacterized protein n=1 Tax=Tanacetum coccineum TaxID=301880 RepID=A0ABQ4YB18_9ASTR